MKLKRTKYLRFLIILALDASIARKEFNRIIINRSSEYSK